MLSGCQYSANADRFLTESPSVEKVVGSYRLRLQTVCLKNPAPTFESSRIVLRGDGTCELVDYPGWNEDDAMPQDLPKLITASGRFSIQPVGSVASFPNDKTCYGIRVVVKDQPDRYFTFASWKGGIELVNEFGDPDQWRFTCWESVESRPNPESCVRPERSGAVNTTHVEQAREDRRR